MKLNYNKAEFTASYGKFSQIPPSERIEIAFAGHSNVGKSTLINKLFNRRNLARVSSVPGKTATINFYGLDNIYFVDLPGYGYAKVSVAEREKWGKMIEKYLNTSKQLKAVLLLIDIRHEPSANDRNMYEWIQYNGFEPIIIATKLDKINRSQVQKHVKMVREGLGAKKETTIIPFSSETMQGREELWQLIEGLI